MSGGNLERNRSHDNFSQNQIGSGIYSSGGGSMVYSGAGSQRSNNALSTNSMGYLSDEKNNKKSSDGDGLQDIGPG